jgi:hypothetical protein
VKAVVTVENTPAALVTRRDEALRQALSRSTCCSASTTPFVSLLDPGEVPAAVAGARRRHLAGAR